MPEILQKPLLRQAAVADSGKGKLDRITGWLFNLPLFD